MPPDEEMQKADRAARVSLTVAIAAGGMLALVGLLAADSALGIGTGKSLVPIERALRR